MFSRSADLYDVLYAFKDYATEAAAIAELLRSVGPGVRAVLDVACGTGEHARRLALDHGFEVDGLDLEPAFLELARRKHPTGRFVAADMADFELGCRYDAVLCLFSSIGYLVTLERVRQALTCFREHLSPGGVVVVEPWFAPDAFHHGRVLRHRGEANGILVERVSRTEVDGSVSRLHFDYRVEGPDGSRSFTEVHELGLFTTEDLGAAFRAAGLVADFDPNGLADRGLWVARTAA